MLSFDPAAVAGSAYLSRHIYRPSAVHTNAALSAAATGSPTSVGGPRIRLAIEEAYWLARASLASVSFLASDEKLVAAPRRVNLAARVSSQPSIFGPGLLVSAAGPAADSSGQRPVEVTLASETPVESVFQNVFASVLSGARLLPLAAPAAAADAEEENYNFLKEAARFSNDLEELERLSGSYNVTKASLRGGGNEVCVRSSGGGPANQPSFSVCLLYGANVERVSRHLIRAGQRAAVKAAWRQQTEAVAMGFHGAWTASERDQILKTGSVRGYAAETVHSVHKFPSLLGQASNIQFRRNGGKDSSSGHSSYH